MSRSSSRPLVVVIHPNPQAQVSLRTTLESGGHLLVSITDDGAEAVRKVIHNKPPVAALIFDWEYLDHNAHKFLPKLVRAHIPQKPFVLALSHDWQLNDLMRAEQLSVSGLLWAPLHMTALVKELVMLKKTGRSKSFQTTRQAITERRSLGKGALARAGAKTDNRWSNRMAALAANARTRSGGTNHEEAIDALLSKMDSTLGRPVSVKLAEAVVLNLKGDAHALSEYLTTHAVDHEAIQKLSGVVQAVGGSSARAQASGRTGPSAISLLLATHVMERVKARAEGRVISSFFKDVRQAAAGYLTEASDAADLSMFMGEWLGLDASVFAMMDRKRARRMAERMLSEPNERQAKDYAHLFALASVLSLRNSTQRIAEKEKSSLVGLASVLSSARDSGEDGLKRLMEMSEELRNGDEDLGLLPGELPDFNEFANLFSEMASEAGGEDHNLAALQRDLEALGMALGSEKVDEDALDEETPQGKLIAALAREVGQTPAIIAALAPPHLISQLPPCRISDWQAKPGQLQTVRALARILAHSGNSEPAKELFRAFYRRYEDEYLMIRALQVAMEATKDEKAIARLRVYLELTQDVPTARDIKGFVARGALCQAMLAASDLPQDSPQTPHLVNLVAMSLRNAGLLTESEWLYKKGLRAAPRRLSLLYNYARLKIERGERQMAGQLLKRALKIDPQHEPSVELLEQIQHQLTAESRR